MSCNFLFFLLALDKGTTANFNLCEAVCAQEICYVAIKKIFKQLNGGVPKRPNGADCKSAGNAFLGSNPSPTTIFLMKLPFSQVIDQSEIRPAAYVLLGSDNQYMHKGTCRELCKRLKDHHTGRCSRTKKRRPLTLFHFEYCKVVFRPSFSVSLWCDWIMRYFE